MKRIVDARVVLSLMCMCAIPLSCGKKDDGGGKRHESGGGKGPGGSLVIEGDGHGLPGGGIPSSDGEQRAVSGKLQTTRGPWSIAESGIDYVCRFPASTEMRSIQRAHCSDVADDGSFTGLMGAGVDWLMFFVDRDLPPATRIKGVLGMTQGAESLISFPRDDMNSDVAMGSVSPSDASGVSLSARTITDNASKFALSVANLEGLAKGDNLMRSVQNNFVNYNYDTGVYYQVGPRFFFTPDGWDSVGQFTTPSADMNLLGYFFQHTTNDPDMSAAKVCAATGRVTWTLTPPEAVSINNGQRSLSARRDVPSPSNPYTTASSSLNGDGSCGPTNSDPSNPQRNWWIAGPQGVGSSATESTMTISSGNYINSSNPGTWALAKNGTEVAWFNLQVAYPTMVDPETRQTVVVAPVPSIKLTKNGDNLSRLDLRWFLYDFDAHAYVALTDDSVLKRLGGNQIQVTLNNFAGDGLQNESHYLEDTFTTAITSFDQTWPVVAGSGVKLWELQVEYTFGGVRLGFWFNFR